MEALLDATSSLVEMKKQTDRLDHEIRVAKERLAARDAEGEGENAEGEMDMEDAEAEAEVEAEGAETVGVDGRGQSVVSTRSGRSTKATRKVRYTLFRPSMFTQGWLLVETFRVNIVRGHVGDQWHEEEADMRWVSLHRFAISSFFYIYASAMLAFISPVSLGCISRTSPSQSEYCSFAWWYIDTHQVPYANYLPCEVLLRQ